MSARNPAHDATIAQTSRTLAEMSRVNEVRDAAINDAIYGANEKEKMVLKLVSMSERAFDCRFLAWA